MVLLLSSLWDRDPRINTEGIACLKVFSYAPSEGIGQIRQIK